VDHYIAQKNYDKAFEYGDKLFALDPDSFQNAMNMIRAASEKGDSERLVGYGEKAQGILKRYKEAPAPAGTQPQVWEEAEARTVESNKDGIAYIQQAVLQWGPSGEGRREASGAPDAVRADLSGFAVCESGAWCGCGVLSASAECAKDAGSGQRTSGKRSNNLGMLLLLSDYYCDKPDQLAKAETYAKRQFPQLGAAPKSEGVTDEQWAQQKSLQKGPWRSVPWGR